MFFYCPEDQGFYHACPNWRSKDVWSEFILKDEFFCCETCSFRFPTILTTGSCIRILDGPERNLPVESPKQGHRYRIGGYYFLPPSDPRLVRLDPQFYKK